MEVNFVRGDIQVSRCQTILLPVSCDGEVEKFYRPIMRRYPLMEKQMLRFLRDGSLQMGKFWLYRHSPKRYVLVCPTRECASDDVELEYIKTALEKLRACYEGRGITSIAVPLLADSDTCIRLRADILATLDIHVELYVENIPLSTSLLPLVEKLTGALSQEDIDNMRRLLCFED